MVSTVSAIAVVPGYYLVCYNWQRRWKSVSVAVVPGYYLVCYNSYAIAATLWKAVVPGYYLVCYNPCWFPYTVHQL